MKIMIRLSCAAAGALALAQGSASAGDGVRDDFWQQGAPAAEPTWTTDAYGNAYPDYGYGGYAYYGDSYTYEYYGYGGDQTGGCVFHETMGGDAMAIALAFGFEVIEVYEGLFVAEPTGANGEFDALWLCQALNGADPFAGAEIDGFLRAPEFEREPEGSGFAGGVLGSWFGRADFLRQNAVRAIKARSAHDFATGAGVIVAVLDTGVDSTHALFTDPPGRVLVGWDFVDLDEDASEDEGNGIDDDGDGHKDEGYGHGTTVAGLVLLAAPAAKILPVRVLDDEGVGTAGRIAAGIRYAIDAGAHVVNLSLGGRGDSPAIRAALDEAMASGVVVVAASGNTRARREGAPPDMHFPASVLGVIAATGRVGREGDVWAPSVGLAGPYPSDRWFRGNGTSYSCALVSGGAALAKQRMPYISSYDIWTELERDRPLARLDLARLARMTSMDLVDLFSWKAVR